MRITKKSSTIDSYYIPIKRKKRNWIWISIFIVIIISIFLIVFNFSESKHTKNSRKKFNPKFKLEGELSFYNKETNQLITTISIEIADNEYKQALGLMYRRSMADTVGMLFIMDEEKHQSFWMRNTYVSLDIIYLDKNLNIVKIQKYTEPFSEESIPSIKNSKYVVEVKAGFCDKHSIIEGDFIKYRSYKSDM